jgi:hypothetical protein
MAMVCWIYFLTGIYPDLLGFTRMFWGVISDDCSPGSASVPLAGYRAHPQELAGGTPGGAQLAFPGIRVCFIFDFYFHFKPGEKLTVRFSEERAIHPNSGRNAKPFRNFTAILTMISP